jgi:hypothetical protein
MGCVPPVWCGARPVTPGPFVRWFVAGSVLAVLGVAVVTGAVVDAVLRVRAWRHRPRRHLRWCPCEGMA